MGSRGPVARPDRKGHTEVATLALAPAPPTPPDPPAGLLAVTRRAWDEYWTSQVARAVEVDADLPTVVRWATNLDEWHRVVRTIRREKRRVVEGSQGQPVLSPLLAYKAQLETALDRLSTELGLTPMARMRLGIKAGELRRLTVDGLNRELDEEPEDVR